MRTGRYEYVLFSISAAQTSTRDEKITRNLLFAAE
jgi:hypothetical protein